MNKMNKTIITVTGIRPDFIRMSEIFKLLDEHFNHILIHTGQHFDKLLSDVFFEELEIRKPDYILNAGKESSNHYEQLGYLSINLPKLIKENNINPDLIIFLGDANTASSAVPLKKEGYTVCHIEAGMRSFDRRMLEEINRVVCDHCSDLLFVYHDNYKKYLENEGITKNVYVVHNTIVEVCRKHSINIINKPKQNNMILMDIHRPESTKYPNRLKNILKFGNICSDKYNIPIKLLYFHKLKLEIDKNNLDLGKIEIIPLMPYIEYLKTIYNCRFIISDSGSASEEAPLMRVPVIVPRDYTERPESYINNCAIKYDVENENNEEIFKWIDNIENNKLIRNIEWLGDGTTAKKIINHLIDYFDKLTV
jgi:UDP-N-acetylglucosamine 2-epimerase